MPPVILEGMAFIVSHKKATFQSHVKEELRNVGLQRHGFALVYFQLTLTQPFLFFKISYDFFFPPFEEGHIFCQCLVKK